MLNHDYAEEAGFLKQSELRVLFLWFKVDKHKMCLPVFTYVRHAISGTCVLTTISLVTNATEMI